MHIKAYKMKLCKLVQVTPQEVIPHYDLIIVAFFFYFLYFVLHREIEIKLLIFAFLFCSTPAAEV